MGHSREKAPPEAGELQREYKFIRELGRGGSAVVYLARDRELQREVAVKLISRPLVADEEAVARFAREARTAAQLNHPHIVSVHAVRRLRDGTLALVMQYVPGHTLKQAIQSEGPFAYDRVERVLREIGAALAHAHEHGIVHRDVKPENIFLDERNGCALLADFGIARVGDNASGLTVAGIALGTPAYMAPEQIDGSVADHRCDLYSLACVGWEMLTGEAPWEGESLYSVIYKQKHEKLAPVRSFRPDVPAPLWWTIERGLEKHPDRRFADAAAMLASLDGANGPGLLERLRSALPIRSLRSGSARPPASGEDQDDDPGVIAAETIRYHRNEVADPAEPAADATPLPLLRRPLMKRSVRHAAVSMGLLLATGLGATLVAVNKASSDAISRNAPAERGSGYVAAAATRPEVPAVPAWDSETLPADSLAGDPAEYGTTAVDSAPDTLTPAPGDEKSASAEAAAPGTVASPEAAGEKQMASTELAPTVEAGSASPEPKPAEQPVREAPPEREAPRFSTSPAIVAGGSHSCTVTSAGQLFCWGGNGSGQLGDGSQTRSARPVQVGGGQAFREIAAGLAHSCGVAAGGEVLCWGSNDSGQLGDGSSTTRAMPRAVAGGRRFQGVGTGSAHTCGLTSQGEIFCWGANGQGQLGDGSSASRTAPRRASSARFSSFAVGWNHTCALDRQGQAFCWGQGSEGQLGHNGTESRNTPTPVAGGNSFRQVAAGGRHTCGRTATGQVFCWGANGNGQLGDGSAVDRAAPVAVAGSASFVAITAGGVHTCGLTQSGEAFCWGRNMYGQLGDGSRSDRLQPVPVAGGLRFSRIHASGSHTCGITRQEETFCWGYNVEGQLGDGTRSHRLTPARVAGAGH